MAILAEDLIEDLKTRLKNPAVSDPEILSYIETAMRDVHTGNYTSTDYISQVLDIACQYLFDDGKFPEITSISAGGVSTSLSGNTPDKRFKERINARRQAAWMA